MLRRERYWGTVEILHRMRAILLELFACTHGSQRTFQAFDAQADAHLQSRLRDTLPGRDLRSTQEALMHFLEVLENDLERLANGQVRLSDIQLGVLRAVRLQQNGES
jgi:hypothetical protein